MKLQTQDKALFQNIEKIINYQKYYKKSYIIYQSKLYEMFFI